MSAVSATHAVVGSVAGMTVGAVGFDCVDWSFSGMGSLMASWVISPVLAGIMAMALFVATKLFILNTLNPRVRILLTIPFFVTFIAMIMTFLIVVKSEDSKVRIPACYRQSALFFCPHSPLLFMTKLSFFICCCLIIQKNILLFNL